MNHELVKRYLLDFQERTLPNVIPRDVKLAPSKRIQTVIGARRVGKTYLLYDKIRELEQSGIPRKRMLFLNFESPTLHDITYTDVKGIVELHWSLYPEVTNQKLYIFIDEPQAMKSWEIAVRDLHDSIDTFIFLTGSSSKLLSKDLATTLRGRSTTTTLLPLSFKEFLRFKDVDVNMPDVSTKTRANIVHLLEEYLRYGGYPEIVLEPDTTEKLRTTKDYFDLTIYKDIIERYNIKNTNTIKWLMSMLIASTAKEMSTHHTFLLLKSQGIKISKNTLYEYMSILEDAFFIFTLRKYDQSQKKVGLSMPKVYAGDISFLNLFSQEEYGRRMENTVFLELLRKTLQKPLWNIHYWKGIDGKEIDFALTEGKKVHALIQVCQSLSDEKTKQREIKALIAGMEQTGINEGIIITQDEEDNLTMNHKRIRLLPLWKWLLQENA